MHIENTSKPSEFGRMDHGLFILTYLTMPLIITYSICNLTGEIPVDALLMFAAIWTGRVAVNLMKRSACFAKTPAQLRLNSQRFHAQLGYCTISMLAGLSFLKGAKFKTVIDFTGL